MSPVQNKSLVAFQEAKPRNTIKDEEQNQFVLCKIGKLTLNVENFLEREEFCWVEFRKVSKTQSWIEYFGRYI